jgi:tyrosyl-tRNA synthetase
MTNATAPFQSRILQTLTERGFIHQGTDLAALDARAAEAERTGRALSAYIGFDCTADSLHAGSLAPIMMLYWWQQCGHRPIVLMGGGTTKVGDPSGKDAARQLLSDDQIAVNMAGIQKIFARYLNFDAASGQTAAVMVNNDDWLSGINYIDFLRDYGRHFSVNRMLGFDSVKLRLEREQPLSFLEFNYMILQAYDFLELHRRADCILQMGGSDQWGNIINGVELIRRVDGKEAFGLTTPLLTTASGAKMGKTAEGAKWLDAARLGVYDFWQYWRNTEDADVGRFLRLFTALPLAEVARLESLGGAELNEAKKILATAVTTLCHGAAAAHAASETARQTFEEGASGAGLPRFVLDAPTPLAAVLLATGLAPSKSEARRLIQGRAVRVRDEIVTDPLYVLTDAQFDGKEDFRISAGKKHHALVTATGSD